MLKETVKTMEQEKKLFVGFDLCESASQISCYSYKLGEPKSICLHSEDEHYRIPTVLFATKNKEWLVGEDALKEKENSEGVFVDGLLSKACNNEMTVVFDVSFDASSLLEKFFMKSLKLMKTYFPSEPIAHMTITVEELNPVIHGVLIKTMNALGIEEERVSVISHSQAYLHYALSQQKELWYNDIGLFDFTEEGLSYYQININRRNTPMLAGVVKKDYTELLQYTMLKSQETNVRYIFENIVNEALHKQIVSAIYFNGVGFEGRWADEIMVKLCAGRRVFKGQNLYTKGACYAAKDYGQNKKEDIILYADEMISSNILIQAYYDAKIQNIILCKATTPWYEAANQVELILDQEEEIRIEVQNELVRSSKKITITLEGLPKRPRKTTRLRLKLTPLNANQLELRITDLGFGMFYKGTHQEWIEQIEL